MLSVSVPNQMPNDCVPALAVNSATSVGMLDAADGADEDQNAAALWPVSTLMPPDGEQGVDDRLQARSPGRGAPTADGAGSFGDEVDGEASACLPRGLARRRSIAFHLMTPVGSRREGSVRLGRNVSTRSCSLSRGHGVSPMNGRCIDKR